MWADDVRHLGVRGCAPRGPLPHLARAVTGLAGEHLRDAAEIHQDTVALRQATASAAFRQRRRTDDATIASAAPGRFLPEAEIFTVLPPEPVTQRQARLPPALQTLLPSTW